MGDCIKTHSLALKEEFEKSSLKRDYGFEEEVLDYLQSFIKDNERKIEIAKRRIESVEDNPELEKMVWGLTCWYLLIGSSSKGLATAFRMKALRLC